MYSFDSEEWLYITGRGWLAVIGPNQIPDGMWNVGVLTGQQVMIDGYEFKVIGVDMARPLISEDNPYRWHFGLLVR